MVMHVFDKCCLGAMWMAFMRITRAILKSQHVRRFCFLLALFSCGRLTRVACQLPVPHKIQSPEREFPSICALPLIGKIVDRVFSNILISTSRLEDAR